MKLDPITKNHILEAAAYLDANPYSRHSLYWLKLDNGNEYQFKEIIRLAYKLTTGSDIDDTFQSNDFYRSAISKKFGFKIAFHVPGNISFFDAGDIDYFAQHAGKDYRSEDAVAVAAGNVIRNNIFKKTNIWADLIGDGWVVEHDNKWQISGKFKKYSWARIYKRGDEDAKVYFTFGVDAPPKALVYKLDCQKKQYTKSNALNTAQVIAFERIVNGTRAQWNEISKDELLDLNWESLRELSLDFLGRYEFLYDEAVKAVRAATGTTTVETKPFLDVTAAPANAFTSLPNKRYLFRGVTIDYDAEQKRNKQTGDSGESLVIAHEKKILEDQQLFDLANKVKKVKDGEGYDILSFHPNADKKYIEVKTTSGLDIRPFMMSDNEWEFMKRHADNYHLYRIYEYNSQLNQGKMYCLSGNLEHQVFTRPKQIEVFLKSV